MPDISVTSSTIAAGVLLGGMLGLTALGLSIVLGVMRLVNLANFCWSEPTPACSSSDIRVSIRSWGCR
jgi:hypothetical protein